MIHLSTWLVLGINHHSSVPLFFNSSVFFFHNRVRQRFLKPVSLPFHVTHCFWNSTPCHSMVLGGFWLLVDPPSHLSEFDSLSLTLGTLCPEYMLIWSFIGVGVLLVLYSVSVPFIHNRWVTYLRVSLFSYWSWSPALLRLSSQLRLPLAWTPSLSHPATHLCTVNWTLIGMWSSPRITYNRARNLTPCRSVGECTSWLPVDRHPPIVLDSLSHDVLSTIYSIIQFWRDY